MGRLDARLQFLQQRTNDELRELAAANSLGVALVEEQPAARVIVLFSGDIDSVIELGFRKTSVAGDVAAGFVPVAQLDNLRRAENVILVESSRAMRHELDVSRVETAAQRLHQENPPHGGAGVIIGVIDNGADYTHRSLRRGNESRLLSIWDQSARPGDGETTPEPFGYGVAYDQTQINHALQTLADGGDPLSVVRHRGRGHGTHVACIAAGNGDGNPPLTFIGVAPEADLIIVDNHLEGALADSANTLDAVYYLMQQARAYGKPLVINMSIGDNLGPHDGTSLLERGIDNLLVEPGHVVVKSVGDEGRGTSHVTGTVAPLGTVAVPFTVPPNDVGQEDTFDIWYHRGDRIEVAVRTPDGRVSPNIGPGEAVTLTLSNDNRVFVKSSLNYPLNRDNRIYLQLLKGSRPDIQPGDWEILLTGAPAHDGTFHAWVQRENAADPVPSFKRPLLSHVCTVTTPGTGRKVITVGAYVTKAESGVGDIAIFSSGGPTRDGRPKPDLVAPGESIMSARSSLSVEPPQPGASMFVERMGTSMAAPHVTGTVALMLAKNRNLTVEQVRDILTSTARRDDFTGELPKTFWGFGKLDTHAAVNAVRDPEA